VNLNNFRTIIIFAHPKFESTFQTKNFDPRNARVCPINPGSE
jgi:hypothetical protein